MNGFIGAGNGLSAKPRVKTSTGAFLKLSKQGQNMIKDGPVVHGIQWKLLYLEIG